MAPPKAEKKPASKAPAEKKPAAKKPLLPLTLRRESRPERKPTLLTSTRF